MSDQANAKATCTYAQRSFVRKFLAFKSKKLSKVHCTHVKVYSEKPPNFEVTFKKSFQCVLVLNFTPYKGANHSLCANWVRGVESSRVSVDASLVELVLWERL